MVWMTNTIYLVALLLFSPVVMWRKWFSRRPIPGFRQKLFGDIPERTSDRPCVWFHAVSLGEVNVLQSVVRQWKQRSPDWDVAISTTTATGMERASDLFAGEMLFYMPYDFSWATNRAIQRIRPNTIVLAELEIWPNLIRLTKANGISISIVNGRLSQKSFRGYSWLKRLIKPLMGKIDLVAAQNETYARRFIALGANPDCVVVTGNIKYDNVLDSTCAIIPTESQNTAMFPHEIVWVAGSTHSPEESIALSVYQRVRNRHTELRLVVVPRHPERGHDISKIAKSVGLECIRRSSADIDSIKQTPPGTVVIVDTIGELTHWWRRADIAFVGGSMTSRGGQNMLEPAALQCAVCFGPNTWNFAEEVRLLLNAKAAECVSTEKELEQFIEKCLASKSFRRELMETAAETVSTQMGATKKTVDLLLESTRRKLHPTNYAA
jgi:3-deoxy-D-manno-octulosonic-acid transferase